jgi:hypothetical protein
MAHLMKHTKASCGHMFAHYDRKWIGNPFLDKITPNKKLL